MMSSQPLRSIVCGVTLLVLFASTASAQQRGGGRGLQQRTRVELATLTEVQSELKLTAEQKSVATEQFAKLREKRGELMRGGNARGAAAELAKLSSEVDAALIAKLDDAQQSRMNGLLLQVNGLTALNDPVIAKALGFNEETLSKLKSAAESNTSARREAMQSLQNASQDERGQKMRELAEKENTALMAALSEADKKKVEELKGQSLTIDMAPLRQRRN